MFKEIKEKIEMSLIERLVDKILDEKEISIIIKFDDKRKEESNS